MQAAAVRPEPEPRESVTVRLPLSLSRRLREEAIKDDRSLSSIVTRTLRKGLERGAENGG